MSAESSSGAGAASCTPGVHGLLRVGAAIVALHVGALQEVIACPRELEALPVAVEGLAGAVRLRGSVIPVLDLRHLFRMPACADAAQVIVLMRHAGHLLGLRCDAVQGMADVDAARLHALATTSGGEAIATHTFEIGERVATVVDPARIAALPGVPMVRTAPADAGAPQGAAGSGPATAHGEPILYFLSGGLPLAISAHAVDATVPELELGDSSLRRAQCLGVFDHHGLEVPVLHTAALLGLASPPPQRTAVLVLRATGGLVGFTMEAVRDIVRVPAAAILPPPALAVCETSLIRGLVEVAGDGTGAAAAPHLLLDHDALVALPLARSLATLNRRLEAVAGAPTSGGRSSRGRPFVTYRVGFETATPLEQVSEIISMPPAWVRARRAGSPLVGVFTHRQAALPLVDLGMVLGRAARESFDDCRVLIVDDDAGRRVGLMVESLGTIEPAAWEQPESEAARETFDAKAFARRPPVVELGDGEARRSLARLNLRGLVRGLHRGDALAAVG